MALAPEKRLQMKKSTTKKKVLKINFRRVLLGFFENWDKSPQKKWDKGELGGQVVIGGYNLIKYTLPCPKTGRTRQKTAIGN